jgi:cytochrome c oxidase subunit II
VVQGYPAVMPTYKGLLKEEQIDGLIAYIKTLQ